MNIIIGIILIVLILALYARWILFAKNQSGAKAREESGVQIFDVLVKGVYSPAVIRAKAGVPVKINFRREESTECSRFVVFSDFHIKKELPEGESVSVEFTPRQKGEVRFTCEMGMYQGKLIVE